MLEGLVLIFTRAAHKALVVIAINPAHGKAIGRSGKPEDFQGIVLLPQQLDDTLILAGFLTADPMALIDNDQRIFIPELLQVRRDRLHTGEGHLMPVFLALQDRKSTRLNSSHVRISYAVFCLKKKNNLHAESVVV